MARPGPIAHGDKLSMVDHLDELRNRLISLIAVFTLALMAAFWQNKRVLEIVNAPLPEGKAPTTFGVAEAFSATLTVSAYAALIVVLPLLVYHVYAFTTPALKPTERRLMLPLMLLAPLLFVAGVAFGYFVVLPAALHFLLGFNAEQFNIQVRAREYYSFFGMTLVSIGVLFQIPIAVLVGVRLRLFTPEQLSANRRYAVLVIAVIAMLLPGTDPVTMLIIFVPLLALYEGSIVLARMMQRSPAVPSEP